MPTYPTASTIPTSTTTAINYDCFLEYLALTNTTDATITVTLQDRQSTAKSFLSAYPVAARTTEIVALPDGGLLFRNGIQWAASDLGIDGWMRISPLR